MKTNYLLLGLMAGALTLASCSKEESLDSSKTEPSQELAASTAATYVSVYTDAACTTPVVENLPLSGAKTDVALSVPFGADCLYIKYPTATGYKVAVQAISATATSDAVSRAADPGTAEYLESDRCVTYTIAKPEDAVKNYVTEANEDGLHYTYYHSSGVILTEDTWPSKSNTDKGADGALFGDFNDFVVDYDLEAVSQDDCNPDQTWREQLKVVMHVRAMGGGYAQRFGLKLEGLDKEYVNSTEIRVTIGNYEVPVQTLGAEVVYDTDGHPIIYISDLQKLRNTSFMAANNMKIHREPENTGYLYNVFNNTDDENGLNVGRGLFTVTTIFRGKDRATLSGEESANQEENYRWAVLNTNKQNFLLETIQKNKTYEIHMPGYEPTGNYTTYAADCNDKAGGVAVAKDADTKYLAADKQGWMIKVPVLTRHAAEHHAFSDAYPQYLDWAQNHTEASAQWYKIENANLTLATESPKHFLYIIDEW